MTWGMGPIDDRTKERLGTTDAMVIRVRRRMIAAVRAHQQHGVVPPGVDTPAAYRMRSGGTFLPKGVDWVEATRELRAGFVEHRRSIPRSRVHFESPRLPFRDRATRARQPGRVAGHRAQSRDAWVRGATGCRSHGPHRCAPARVGVRRRRDQAAARWHARAGQRLPKSSCAGQRGGDR